jgi:hypothetical protein
MLRASINQRFRCANHPHRIGERACARCKIRYCAECFPDQATDRLCDICAQELADIDLELHPPFEERVRRFVTSVRNLLIGLAIMGVLAIPGYFVVRDLVTTQITPEEWARFKYAAGGTFETPEGTMVFTTVLGGRIAMATSESPPNEARRLIDEYWGDGFVGWRSTDASFPQEIVVQAGNPARFDKVLFAHDPMSPPETWAREVEVLASMVSPTDGFRSVGRYRLEQTLEPQRFEFASTDGQWFKLRILSNYGSTEYTSLHEFNGFISPRGPFGIPTTTP